MKDWNWTLKNTIKLHQKHEIHRDNLTKYDQVSYTENYKTFLKEIKEVNRERFCVHSLKNSILLYY